MPEALQNSTSRTLTRQKTGCSIFTLDLALNKDRPKMFGVKQRARWVYITTIGNRPLEGSIEVTGRRVRVLRQ